MKRISIFIFLLAFSCQLSVVSGQSLLSVDSCLSLIGFTNTEMAILFGVKYNAINSRVSKIKKIFETEENLRDFVVKNLKN